MNFNKIIDISMELNEKTIVWKDDAQPKLIPLARIPHALCNFTWLDFGAHAGTHIDAPFYLFNDKWTSDKVPFDRLIGRCQVLDLTNVDEFITEKDLRKLNITQQMILLKTKNSYDKMEKYNPYHVALSIDATQYLIDKGVKVIGYDYQSFERDGRIEIHRMFMSKDIVIIDNLRLLDAKAKEYQLICLPIRVTGIDAAPARAILLED
ncbi:MAG: cyclase family protein [Candidatus Woesearchaeota archaeon]